MTTRPSIESLRETLYEIIPPSDPESEHPGRFSDLLAALDELERLRQMPTLEAAAIARADALAARCEALRSSLTQADMVIHKTVFPMFERRMGSSISECQACEVLASTRAAGLLDEGREG